MIVPDENDGKHPEFKRNTIQWYLSVSKHPGLENAFDAR